MNKSHVSDAERAFLANAAYPASAVTSVKGNTGEWEILGRPKELGSGLEIYALHKPGTSEVVFAVRGSDLTPTAGADWGVNGANLAFSGRMHAQYKEAIEFVHNFMRSDEYKDAGYTYSTTGHSKGGGIAQILAHTFGLEGTALDPAPAGAVVASEEYKAFVASLGIDPPGVPEHGFTNYPEKGSLVGDCLDGLDIPAQILTLPGIREVVRHYTSLGVQHDGMIHVGPNLGDTVMVDLEPGSFWNHLHMVDNILAQHSPFDDALLLAAEGPLAIIGNQVEAFRESLQVLEQARQKFEETARASGMELQGREVTRQIDARMEALHTRIDALEDLRIDKVEEEFGYADTWMRDPGFHPGVMSAGVLEQYRDYLQHGVDGLVSARLYLNGRELSALSGQDSADSDSRAARIEELRKEQIELLHTLHGENLDSWMLTSEFLANPLGEGASAFAALTPEQIEAVRQENAISSLQAEIDRVERILDNRAESRGRTDPVPSDPEQVVAADDAVLHSDVPQDNTTNDSDRDILSLPLEEDQLPGQRIGRVLRTVSLQQNLAGAGSMLPAMGLGLHLFLSALRPGMVSGPGLAAMPLDQEPVPLC
ncbi:hypothetical protein ACLG6S_17665 [Thermodesulfobacteriota bacterium B35]